MRKNTLGTIVITITLLIAIILTIMPLPIWATWARPLWVLMVLSYWALALEDRVGIGIAWLVGILLDILNGTLFAEHALVMTLAIYVVLKFKHQIRMFPVWQQAVVMCLLSFMYQGVIYIIQGMIGHSPDTVFYWLPLLTTLIFWPWVFILLRDCRRRFKVS
jgi:rod shape-determining protein MreD